jgi:hypothetical protein
VDCSGRKKVGADGSARFRTLKFVKVAESVVNLLASRPGGGAAFGFLRAGVSGRTPPFFPPLPRSYCGLTWKKRCCC